MDIIGRNGEASSDIAPPRGPREENEAKAQRFVDETCKGNPQLADFAKRFILGPYKK